MYLCMPLPEGGGGGVAVRMWGRNGEGVCVCVWLGVLVVEKLRESHVFNKSLAICQYILYKIIIY